MNQYISSLNHQIRISFLTLFCLLLSFSSLSQNSEEADSVSAADRHEVSPPEEDQEKLVWISLFGGGGLSQWNHSSADVTMEPVPEIGGGFTLNFRVVDWLEISMGAGLSMFQPEAGVASFEAEFSDTDSEGAIYEHRVSATNVVEKQEYMWARFPLSARYVFNPGRWDIYLDVGAEYRMALKSTFEQSGTFSNHGYYSEYDLLIDDLPTLGFYDEVQKNVDGDLNPDDLIMPFAGLGVIVPGKKSHFFLEGRYYFASQDPFTGKQDLLFPGPVNNESAIYFSNKSVMESGEVSLSAFRVVIGVRF